MTGPVEPKKPEISYSLVGNEKHVVEQKKTSDVEKKPENGNSSWGYEESQKTVSEMVERVRYSGHSLRWAWLTDRQAQRGHFRSSFMRNWEQRTWKCEPGIIPKNASVISKPKTLEVWIKAPKQTGAEDMVHKAALRALRCAWVFAKWQGITIRLKKTSHPSDVQGAHIVLETERSDVRDAFRKEMVQGISPRSGPVIDGSHAYKPELTGQESAEGGIGFDWLLYSLPPRFQQLERKMALMELENQSLGKGMTMILERLKP